MMLPPTSLWAARRKRGLTTTRSPMVCTPHPRRRPSRMPSCSAVMGSPPSVLSCVRDSSMPMYLLADWYADAVEPVTPFRRRTPPTVECRTRKTEWGERRRSSAQGGYRPSWGKAAKREAASLLLSRRPARVEAAALTVRQPCRRHVESVGAKDALRPTGRGRGAEGAPSSESSGRSDQLQLAGRVPDGRRTYVKLQPPDVDRGRRTYVKLRRFGPCCLRRATSNPQRQQFPRGRPSRERIIRQVRPGQQGSRPQVSMVGNLG